MFYLLKTLILRMFIYVHFVYNNVLFLLFKSFCVRFCSFGPIFSKKQTFSPSPALSPLIGKWYIIFILKLQSYGG